MYYLTGLPGWMRFGFSPGWLGRSPTGLPPMAQWIMQNSSYQGMPESYYPRPFYPPSPTSPSPYNYPPTVPTKEEEKRILEEQLNYLESQIEAIKQRIKELSREE